MTGQESYAAAVGAIRGHAEDLGDWLAVWAARDDSKPDARTRRCASGAVGAIDTMLSELHGIRAQLVTEIRKSDDAAAARADELLARSRQLRQEEDR